MIITNKTEIQKLQKKLERELKKYCNRSIATTLIYPGGRTTTKVLYSRKFDFWFSPLIYKSSYWNGFGKGIPNSGGNTLITCEINIKWIHGKRPSFRKAGLFVCDEKGKVSLYHTGNIRIHNRPSKPVFWKNWRRKEFGEINIKGHSLAFVSDIDSPDIASNIGKFVSFVKTLKP